MDVILFGFTISCGENEGTSASEYKQQQKTLSFQVPVVVLWEGLHFIE